MSTLLYCVFVLSLTACWSRSVPSEEITENGDRATVKCSCTIMADMMEDSPYHSFGVIQTYTLDGHENQCHDIRHKCRKECALRADLGSDVAPTKSLGKQLCEKLGIPTIHKGARLSSHASMSADLDNPCVSSKSRYGHYLRVKGSEEVLCCGNSIDGFGATRLGWDRYCDGRIYELVPGY